MFFQKNRELKIINWEKIIIENNIDFTKKTWGTSISKVTNKSPQYCLQFVKKYLSKFLK